MKFIKAVRAHYLEVLFLTALNTGMRKGELLTLTWNNIDFKNKTTTANKSVKHIAKFDETLNRFYEYVLQTPKTEKSNRVIPITDVLVDYLKRRGLKYKENKMLVAVLYDDNKIVFCNQFGRYLDGSFVLKKYKNILKRANFFL